MKNMKNKKNKRLAIFLLVFALVFVGGGVYAAASGVLTFKGVASLDGSNVNDELKVEYKYSFSEPTGTNGSTGTMEITPDGQTINVTADLQNPGDYVDFTVYVKNTGTVDAKLGSYTLTSPDYTPDELIRILSVTDSSYRIGIKNGLVGKTLRPGEFTEVLYTVQWVGLPDAADHAGESINFSLSIDYQAA